MANKDYPLSAFCGYFIYNVEPRVSATYQQFPFQTELTPTMQALNAA